VRRLTVGTERFVKPLRFYPWMAVLLTIVLSAALGLGSFFLVLFAERVWEALSGPDWAAWKVALLGGGIAFLAVSYAMQKPRQPTGFVISRLLPIALAPLVWLMAGSQLLFNHWYLAAASYRSIGLDTRPPATLDRIDRFSQRNRPRAIF
jgi:hypothetical protein